MDMFEDGFAGILRFQEFYKLFVSQSVESYTGSQMQSLFFVDSGVTKTEKAEWIMCVVLLCLERALVFQCLPTLRGAQNKIRQDSDTNALH